MEYLKIINKNNSLELIHTSLNSKITRKNYYKGLNQKYSYTYRKPSGLLTNKKVYLLQKQKQKNYNLKSHMKSEKFN